MGSGERITSSQGALQQPQQRTSDVELVANALQNEEVQKLGSRLSKQGLEKPRDNNQVSLSQATRGKSLQKNKGTQLGG